jgi:hypothetical protein
MSQRSSSVVYSPRIKTLAAALSIALAGAASSIATNADARIPAGQPHAVHTAVHNIKHRDSRTIKFDKHHVRAAVLQIAGGIAASKPAARAPTTVHISTLTDSGAGSLREALANAADGDILDLSSVHGTLKLSSPLVPSASVSLVGPGQQNLTLDGRGLDRIITSTHSLKLSNVTVANGATPKATAAVDVALGGCLFVQGNLTLTNATLSNCVVDGTDTNYQAAYGGAIAVAGTLAMYSSTIKDNTATAPYFAGGGGIEVINSQYGYNNYITGSTLSGNQAIAGKQVVGGALDVYYTGYYNVIGQTTIANSTVSGNSGTATSIASYYDPNSYEYVYTGNAFGGGIQARAGTVTLTSSNVTGNSVTANNFASGGGVYSIGGSYYDTAAGYYYNVGGGITVIGGSVSNNTSTSIYSFSTGGALQSHSDTTLTNAVLSGNTVDSGCLACLNEGGAIYQAKYGNLTITGSTLSGNTVNATASGASAGGAITTKYYGGANIITLTNSTISGNSVTATGDPTQSFGGAIYQAFTPAPGSLITYNSTIAYNTAGGVGGGVSAGYETTLTFNSTIVGKNTATGTPDSSDFGTPVTATVGGDYNLVQTDPTSAGFTFTGTHNIIGEDPLLLPLANNGGTTQTHALDPASPAIDTGSNPLSLTTDQRGVPYARVVGAAADIGAFELDTDRIFANGFED